MEKTKSRKFKLLSILLFQAAVVIYTTSGIFAKFASGYPFLSAKFVGFYAAEIAVLGVYALLWQQLIKRFDLSYAYANRSVSLVYSMIWAAVIFGDRITPANIIGAVTVIAGTVIVNTGDD